MPKSSALSPQRERLAVLDVAKGFCMLFVVFAHVNYTPILLKLIYSFHMPLFFILAGVVYRREKYPSLGTFLRRRWQNLILPYLTFSVVSIVYVFLSEKIFPYTADLSKDDYWKAFAQIFLAQGSTPVLNTPLWFVPCLLTVEILYYQISLHKLPVVIPVCITLMSLGWLLESGKLPFDNTRLPWTLDSALFALGFYASGNILAPWIKKSIEVIQSHPKKVLLCLNVIVGCLIFWLPLTLINGKVSLGSRVLNNGVLFYLTGMLGTAVILAISILLEKSRVLLFLGKNTFCIMSVHYMIRKYTLPKYYSMLGIEKYKSKSLKETILPFLIVLVLTIFITLVYIWIVHKMQKHREACKVNTKA